MTELFLYYSNCSLYKFNQDESFENISKVHDWRNYIPDEIKEIWNDLTLREKQLLFIMAEQQADKEEWE